MNPKTLIRTLTSIALVIAAVASLCLVEPVQADPLTVKTLPVPTAVVQSATTSNNTSTTSITIPADRHWLAITTGIQGTNAGASGNIVFTLNIRQDFLGWTTGGWKKITNALNGTSGVTNVTMIDVSGTISSGGVGPVREIRCDAEQNTDTNYAANAGATITWWP